MKDKVIVVTGASGGIGAALVQLVARKGALPVLLARREAELREVASLCGEKAFYVVADVSRRADVERAFAEAVNRFGHVDVWVNNAGRGISKKASELSDEDFDQMMSVNVKSALYGIQTVLPHFKQRGSGHIVNVSSMLGRIPYVPQRSAYCAAKHALNALTVCLRMELRAEFPGIRVSSVVPGGVATEFGVNALHGGFDSRKMPGTQSPEEVAAVIASVIESPRADVYTRPENRQLVAAYYAADDMADFEQRKL